MKNQIIFLKKCSEYNDSIRILLIINIIYSFRVLKNCLKYFSPYEYKKYTFYYSQIGYIRICTRTFMYIRDSYAIIILFMIVCVYNINTYINF